MSDKVNQKSVYNYNKDITYFEKRENWWGKVVGIAFLSTFLSIILVFTFEDEDALNEYWEIIFLPLFVISLFLVIPISVTAWLYNYLNLKSKKFKLGQLKKDIENAIQRESARDYDAAIEMWEKVGDIEEAARVRKLQAEEGKVKVDQTVVHGDYVDDRDTIIKDSVLNRSNVGAGGKTKGERIKLIKELLDSGAIDKDDYEKMKREIIG